MDQQKKKRGENWSSEEKDILRELISQSAHILEDKSTKTNINILKAKEWKNVMIRLIEITGKKRSEAEIKLAWKRMKLSAKANISSHRQEQLRTGGGEKPPSPSPEDLAIMAIAPHDFVVETSDYDSDALLFHHNSQMNEDVIAEPSHEHSSSNNIVIEVPETSKKGQECIIIEQVISETNKNKAKKGTKSRKETTRDDIIASNINFKEKHLEMLETEHKYNIEIAKLKIQKLQLQIELLQTNKNTPN